LRAGGARAREFDGSIFNEFALHNSTVASENNVTVKAKALAKENSVHPGFERRTHAWQAGSLSLYQRD
jgi:hypothetical protein